MEETVTVGGNASAAPPPAPAPAWRSTMGMQQTAAMAVAYSASCGIALVDDASLSAVCRPTLNTLEELNSARRDVETGGEDRMPAVISPQELQESALVCNLIQLANGRRLFPGCLADRGRSSSSS